MIGLSNETFAERAKNVIEEIEKKITSIKES